jgi:3-methyladenine DNA glycosylase/8-oxoguanine DNA glycosylase
VTGFAFEPRRAVSRLRRADPGLATVIDAAGERWRPFRTVASWYLWHTLNR